MDGEERLRKVEKAVAVQAYLVPISLILSLVCCAFAVGTYMDHTKPNYDHIAVTLTVFQTLFGIAALFGFWSLRSLTRERAEEVAKAEIANIARPMIRRQIDSTLEKMAAKGQVTDADAMGMLSSMSDEEGGG